VRLAGQTVALGSPVEAIRAGLALVPEDRKLQGIILEMAVRENISLPGERRNAKFGVFRDGSRERGLAGEMIGRLRIKTPNDRQFVQFLSGGNQQKVALAKWLPLGPRLLLLDEPTRGIDVGAKYEIYQLINDLAGEGKAIVMISSDLPEVLGMSDRILVMHAGRVTGEIIDVAHATQQQVMELAVA
jgi:ABC-type sugar transport system ATPase subunit